MRSLVVLVCALVGGCADCGKKPDEAIPAPPQAQPPPALEQKPASGKQYNKVMDLHPVGVPKPFAPGVSASTDGGADAP